MRSLRNGNHGSSHTLSVYDCCHGCGCSENYFLLGRQKRGRNCKTKDVVIMQASISSYNV